MFLHYNYRVSRVDELQLHIQSISVSQGDPPPSIHPPSSFSSEIRLKSFAQAHRSPSEILEWDPHSSHDCVHTLPAALCAHQNAWTTVHQIIPQAIYFKSSCILRPHLCLIQILINLRFKQSLLVGQQEGHSACKTLFCSRWRPSFAGPSQTRSNLWKNWPVEQNRSTRWVKKQDTLLLHITSPNVDRFSKFFHLRTQK